MNKINPIKSSTKDLLDLNILIHDDNFTQCILLEESLISLGYKNIFLAQDTFTALEYIINQDIDILITDFGMIVGMTFDEFYYAVNSIKKVKIIVITAANKKLDYIKRKYIVVDALPKTISVRILSAAIINSQKKTSIYKIMHQYLVDFKKLIFSPITTPGL